MDKDITIQPDDDIQTLRDKIKEVKELKQRQELMNELNTLLQDTVRTPNEFEGVMHMPDRDKLFHTKRKKLTFMEHMLERISKMMSPLPIINNIIGLVLSLVVFLVVHTKIFIPLIKQYPVLHNLLPYGGVGAIVVGAFCIIKSSSRSLLLGLGATIVGGIVAVSLPHGETLFNHGAIFYLGMMAVGLFSVLISALNMH